MLYKARKKRVKRRIKLILVLIAVFLLIRGFEAKISDFSKAYFPNFARQETTKAVTAAVDKIISEGKYSYDKLAQIQYSDGSVSAVETKSSAINELKARVTRDAENELEKISHSSAYIPLGAFTGLSLIANYGPEIKLSYCLTGSISAELESSFESAGINQTVHHIKLIVTAKVVTASVDFKETLEFKTDFEIAQSVIVGSIPTTYGGYYAALHP